MQMHRNKSVSAHDFAMVPRTDIPRSTFKAPTKRKFPFDAGDLVPFFWKTMYPGDTIKLRHTIFARLATPIFPTMDNLTAKTFYFFVPSRILWDNFEKQMGQQTNPGDTTSYLTPVAEMPAGGYAIGSLQDYLGLPTVGQVAGSNTGNYTNMVCRAYNTIYNYWFRDQNLQNSIPQPTDNGPDTYTDFVIRQINKAHDYFTACLPWTQKGNAAGIPLSGTAPVKGLGISTTPDAASSQTFRETGGYNTATTADGWTDAQGSFRIAQDPAHAGWPNIYANLSDATITATINQLRLSWATQSLYELDARGGTRYPEIVRAHFGVFPPDFRFQWPQYIGGGSQPIIMNPVAQTSGTSASGTTTPLGNLAGMATLLDRGQGFTFSVPEHGYIMGIICVVADLGYSQGINREFTDRTRLDRYWPVFASIGEQAVYKREIYCDGSSTDDEVFGYQEAWAHLHYNPNMVMSLMRPTAAGTIAAWHYGELFGSVPTLNSTFITSPAKAVVSRATAVGSSANGQQLLCDAYLDIVETRQMPMYSVPGMFGRF